MLVLLQKFVKHGNQVVVKGEHIVLAKVALIVITLSEDAQVDSGACCINIKLLYFQFELGFQRFFSSDIWYVKKIKQLR